MSRWCPGPASSVRLRRHHVCPATRLGPISAPRAPVQSLTATRTASFPLTRGPGNIPGPHVIGLSLQRLIHPLAAAAAARERACHGSHWPPLSAAGPHVSGRPEHWIRSGNSCAAVDGGRACAGYDMWALVFYRTGHARTGNAATWACVTSPAARISRLIVVSLARVWWTVHCGALTS